MDHSTGGGSRYPQRPAQAIYWQGLAGIWRLARNRQDCWSIAKVSLLRRGTDLCQEPRPEVAEKGVASARKERRASTRYSCCPPQNICWQRLARIRRLARDRQAAEKSHWTLCP